MKVSSVVFYHYHESNTISKFNLLSFLISGIRSDLDYVFIIAGVCSVPIPERENIKIIFTDNLGSDLVGYGAALGRFETSRYETFAFVNCTMAGPFQLPFSEISWLSPFINLLETKPDMKLVGSTINILPIHSGFAKDCQLYFGKKAPFPHVQSMVFVADRQCIEFLLEKGVFKSGSKTRHDLITQSEIAMSTLVLQHGWNIGSIVAEYMNLDYRSIESDINMTSIEGDPWFPDACFGRTLHPFETIFFKTNRGLRSFKEIRSLILAQKRNIGDSSSSRYEAMLCDINL